MLQTQARVDEIHRTNPDAVAASAAEGNGQQNAAAKQLLELNSRLERLRAHIGALDEAMKAEGPRGADGPLPDYFADYGAAMVERLVYQALGGRASSVWGAATAQLADPLKPTCAFATILNGAGGGGCISAAMSPGGVQVAAGFGDSGIRIWQTEGADQAEKDPLIGHGGCVHSLSWHPSQRFLISGAADGDVRLWNVKDDATHRCLCIYPSLRNNPIHTVAWNPVGHFFLSGGRDSMLKMWSSDRVFPVRMMVGHSSDVTACTWHPNLNYMLSGSFDKTLRLWDVRGKGTALRILTGHFGPVLCCAISPNGQFAAAGATDGSVRVWDISTAKEVALFTPDGQCNNHGGRATAAANAAGMATYALAFSCDGAALAAGGADCAVRIWEASPDVFGNGDRLVPTPPVHTSHTKATSILSLSYTDRNLLLGVGGFMADRMLT